MMRLLLVVLVLVAGQVNAKQCSDLLNFDMRTLNTNDVVNLCDMYQGNVVLIVNTASKCAYTDQYDSLEKLHKRYKNDGLVVLGFPSNDFGRQEPGTEKQIKAFCRLTYGVQFPMFAKTKVKQHHADPIYQALANASGNYPRWNFHKYLLDRKGRFVMDYPSSIEPLDQSVVSRIESLLADKVDK